MIPKSYTIRQLIENLFFEETFIDDKVMLKYGMHDVDVRETVGKGEPLFVTCRQCHKSALNTGTGKCLKCHNRKAWSQI